MQIQGWIKYFKRGPNIPEIFVPGSPNISTNYPGDPNISINLRPGSTENGGPLFLLQIKKHTAHASSQ